MPPCAVREGRNKCSVNIHNYILTLDRYCIATNQSPVDGFWSGILVAITFIFGAFETHKDNSVIGEPFIDVIKPIAMSKV